jgi:hypothetical protein
MEVNATAAAEDMNGQYVFTEGDTPTISSRMNAGSLNVDVAAKEPGGSGTLDLSIVMADIAANSDGTMMMGNMQDMAAMLASGFFTDADISHGAATYTIDFQDKRNSFAFDGKSDTGRLAVALNSEALSYEAATKGFSFTMSGSDIPLPEVAASFVELGIGFMMPVGKSDVPQDFGAQITLDGMSVSDMIWGMIDPGAQLPHDPATIIADLTGTANWFFNIMDPKAQAEIGIGAMPGEIHALDINEVRVAVGGAELTASGGFTFDNSDLETFGGIPAPTGSVDLKLVGGNGLMDKLVAMGLLPQDQAMGARMMLGLFARPGEGEDTLVSKIEVSGDGAISANGQRLQ